MINYLSNKILNTLIIIFLGAQCLIFFLNQKPLTKNFSQKNITVENFSSIVLSKSGITKIGSEKLNKIDEDERRLMVEKAIESVGLTDKMDSRPNMLSGGECQRTAIARAIVHQPALVLADEPTANLDAENSHHIMKILSNLNQEMSTSFIFATHDEKIMTYLRRIIHLDDGQITEDEKIENPKASV